MAQTKEFFTRIMQKHDTEANWASKTSFIPLKGEIIVYDKDEAHPYERFKIGDGENAVTDLSFNGSLEYFVPKTDFTTVAGNNRSGSYLSTKWSVNGINGITVPYNGMVITIRVPAAGVSTAGIVLSINNGTNYYPVVRNVSTVISTEYAVNSTIVLVFNADQTASAYLTSNTKSTITGCWQIADANSTYSNASLGNGYATCSTAAETVAKVASLSSYSLSTGGAVSVKFTYDVPANATLNINSKGAKNIYYRGAKIPAGIIKAGDVATFVYSSYYHLIAIDRWQKDIDDMLALKGDKNGFAELDANGKVPTSQLPSYVDDVLEYSAKSSFPATGETGKIYLDIATNIPYRWSGSTYVEISTSLALGETSSTAYRGDRGAVAYAHAASAHAPVDAEPNQNAFSTIMVDNGTGVSYSAPSSSSSLEFKGENLNINATNNGKNGDVTVTLSVPDAGANTKGVTVVYPAASCTTFSSDAGTVTPLAVQKGAKMFAVTRPTSSTTNAITRYSNTIGDVKDSKILIEDVTNTKDTSKTAQVLSIPAEGGKKMVYGYCTDQIDGTSFIGGVFPNDATEFPYASGLAIGGTSGNLLWKGNRVLDNNDLAAINSAISNKPDNDTKNTAGSTNTSNKIFLVGATSQAANPQTYSHDTAYVGTDGYLYSNSEKVWPRIYSTLIPYGTAIPANADLNTIDYLKVGNYCCSSNATVQTLKNCPLTTYGSDGVGTSGAAFMMQVYSPLSATFDDETTGTWKYRIRVITHYNTGLQYKQYCYVGGTAGAANWSYGDWYLEPRSKFTFNKTSASTAAIGSATNPVYIDSTGTIQKTTYTLGKSVPSDAKFTDTTYTFNGAVSTIKDSNLTANRALVSDANGKVAVSAVTATELSYLDGVTSAIQTQINNLKTSFQDGCDTLVAGCTTYGDTPASNSPSDIVTSIKNIYNNRYNSGVTATKVGTATAAHVLSGKTFTNSSGVGITGTMTNNGAISQTLAANGSYTIPAGYHNGSGKVTQSLTTKAATTYGAKTSDQTIAANQYLTGVQTIKKVEQSGLSAANIVKGKTITISSNGSNLWSITGTGTAINPSAMKMYIGSSTPSSPNEADIFYNMSNDNYYIYNNGSWVKLTKQVLQLIVFNGTTFANGYSLQTVGKNSSTVGTFLRNLVIIAKEDIKNGLMLGCQLIVLTGLKLL